MAAIVRGRDGIARRSQDLEPQVADHRDVVLRPLPLCRQVIADEDRVRHQQPHRLQRPQVMLAPAGDAQFALGVRQTHQAQDLQAARRRQRPALRQRRAGDRDQEVHRDRVRADAPKRLRHLHDVLVALAHAEERAAARRQPRVLHHAHRLDAVRVRVRLADLAVEPLARVQVVVVREDARVLQLGGLPRRQQPQAGADLRVRQRRAHLAHRRRDVRDIRVARPAPGRHHAHAPRAERVSSPGRREDLAAGQQVVLVDRRLREPGLRAVVAVLRADAALDVDEEVHFHGVAEGAPPQQVRRRHDRRHLRVRRAQHRQRLLRRRCDALDRTLRDRHPVHVMLLRTGRFASTAEAVFGKRGRGSRLPEGARF